ncbi:MAG: DNA repair protein RecO [Thiovulaceae bacterium]|nr:DNA repair protein RecO [Sulfurimonadaceae bacterium]
MKLQIIVLNTVKFRDSGLILNGYSNLFGRQGFIVYGGVRTKKNNTLSQLHPLSIIDAELSSTKKSKLPVIKEFSASYNLINIRTGIIKNSISVFIGELIYKTLREIEPDRELFSFLVNAIIRLEQEKNNVPDFHPRFIVNYCKHLGYLPEKNFTPSNNLFEIQSGGFSSPDKISGIFFSLGSSTILLKILETEEQISNPLLLSGESRFTFISDMIRYIEYHQGVDIKIKSLKVLHEVFE